MTSSFLDLEKIAEAKPENLDNVVEAVRVFQKGMTGGFAHRARLQEAFTTADFPQLLSRGLDIELMDRFKNITPDWQAVADEYTVNDFRPKKLVDLFGISDFDDVNQGEEYKGAALQEAAFEIQVGKTGRTVGLTWELNLNQDWDAINRLPERIAKAARRTEDKKVFNTLFNDRDGGFAYNLFTVDDLPNNLPLTAANLQKVLEAMAKRKDYNEDPVDASKMVLMVHPSLKFQAERIVNSDTIETTEGKTKTTEKNPFRGTVTVHAPQALAAYAKGDKAATTWFLLPAPGSSNPALAKVNLRGHEDPDIRVKNDQGTNPTGGGVISPDEGSFADDTIWFRGRHVTGGAALLPFATYASTGQ
ncbi:Mu-like prophage major head subunit gpT family protein [Rothia koreensis]|uniref:phage major capsid protein n=1 Tax=Rothia koreensis TaxID=592378 RepID=UPI0037CACFD2